MPISGPGGPTGPRGVVPTAPKDSAEEVAAPESTLPTTPAGWTAAGPAKRPPLNLELVPPPKVDMDALPNPVQAQVRTALDTYQKRIETTLHHDAMSIARGLTPTREGDPLTEAQQKELHDATTDLLKDMPLGLLSPELMEQAQQGLAGAGIKTRDIPSTRLRDAGKIGQDVAKDLVGQLKDASPKTYYGIAAGLAAVAGFEAYQGGSKQLDRLGIKPEVDTKFFDGDMKLKLRGDWNAHFKDFKTTAELEGKVDLGDYGRLTGSVTANSKTGFEKATVGYNLQREDFNLSANITANARGVETVSGSANWHPREDFNLSMGASHNFQTGDSTATAEATWKQSKNVDWALSGHTNFRGESYVGVGVAIKF
jgi:hypothetical protein